VGEVQRRPRPGVSAMSGSALSRWRLPAFIRRPPCRLLRPLREGVRRESVPPPPAHPPPPPPASTISRIVGLALRRAAVGSAGGGHLPRLRRLQSPPPAAARVARAPAPPNQMAAGGATRALIRRGCRYASVLIPGFWAAMACAGAPPRPRHRVWSYAPRASGLPWSPASPPPPHRRFLSDSVPERGGGGSAVPPLEGGRGGHRRVRRWGTQGRWPATTAQMSLGAPHGGDAVSAASSGRNRVRPWAGTKLPPPARGGRCACHPI